MRKSLYSKDISLRCEYCSIGIIAPGGKEVLCRKTGVMQLDSSCKKFRYDPLKRKPQTISLNADFSEDDFKL